MKPSSFSLALASGLILSGACAESLPGIAPPTDEAYFPIGMVLLSEGGGQGTLVVANSNFDQRFNAGTLLALDVEAMRGAIPNNGTGDGNITFVDSLAPFAVDAVKIPSFAGDLAQAPNLSGGSPDGSLLFVGSRGRNELTMVRFSPDPNVLLDCGNQTNEGDPIKPILGLDCTEAHRIPTNFEDPFALAYAPPGPSGSEQGLVAVGHLRTREENGLVFGDVSLVDVGDFQDRVQREREGNDPGVALLPNHLRAFGGVTGLSYVPVSLQDQPYGMFIVGGRQVGGDPLSVTALSVVRGQTEDNRIIHQLQPVAELLLDASLSAIEMRSLAVDQEKDRIYASVRFSAIGDAFNAGIAVIEIDRERNLLVVRSVFEIGEELQRPTLLRRGDARYLYVSDIRTDRIWILDVSTDQPLLVSSIFGRATRMIEGSSVQVATLDSPAQIVFTDTSSASLAPALGFVSNFANSTIAVLDVSSADPREHKVVARLGRNLDADGQMEKP